MLNSFHSFIPNDACNQSITLEELLNSREQRSFRQHIWLARYSVTLISFTVISPGAIKDTILTRSVFKYGWQALTDLMLHENWQPLAVQIFSSCTGAEGFISVAESACKVKKAALNLEQNNPIGRLWDIDIIGADGQYLSRSELKFTPRKCLICSKNAKVCAKNRTHPVAELISYMEKLYNNESYHSMQ